MRQCLFCNNVADSKEHLWASWILERVKWAPIRHSIGNSPVKILATPELKVKSVCKQCNNGWMSALEQQNKPLMGCLMQDIYAPIDHSQQSSLTAWAMKTAMVLDSVNTRDRTLFYQKGECENLRVSSAIPPRTEIWIGRYSVRNTLGAFGTDLGIAMPEAPKAATGCATTILAGHLAIQVLAVHVLPEYKDQAVGGIAPKPGRWNDLLTKVWPIGSQPIIWPPPLSFVETGPLAIATLMGRWKIGKSR